MDVQNAGLLTKTHRHLRATPSATQGLYGSLGDIDLTKPGNNNYSVCLRPVFCRTKRIEFRTRFERLKQDGGGNVQAISKAQQIQDRDITPSFFNLTEIVGAQTGLVRESLLGQSTLLAIAANRGTEELQGWSWTRSPFCHGVPMEESV